MSNRRCAINKKFLIRKLSLKLIKWKTINWIILNVGNENNRTTKLNYLLKYKNR